MLRENICKGAILFKDYAEVGNSIHTADRAAELIKGKIPEELYSWGVSKTKYEIKGSIGRGRTLETPWIAVMRKSITTSVQRGAFVIYIYSADLNKIFLGLMLGCANFKGSGRGEKKRIRKLANTFAQKLDIPKMFCKSEMPLNGKESRTESRTSNYSIATICYKEYNLSDMPTEDELKVDFDKAMDIYNAFSDLVGYRTIDQFFAYYEALGDELIENEYALVSTDNSLDNMKTPVIDTPLAKQAPIIDHKGNKHYSRDRKKKKNALACANYTCEYDNTHFSFWAKSDNSKMYVEAHHLIPLSNSEEFNVSLDVEANIVSLCPNCHRCVHYGEKHESMLIMRKLLEKRKERLKHCGINFSEDNLDALYESLKNDEKESKY